MAPTLLFLIFLVLIAGVLVAVWRYWGDIAHVTPEEEEFDERVAALNERQANRLSDERLTQSLTDEEAWQIMVRRGQQRERGGRGTRRIRGLLPPARQQRYGGELRRRIEERRERYGDARTPDDAKE